MGQILGLGITHYPNLAADLNMAWRMQKTLDDPALPPALRDPANWHPTMRAQWGTDSGRAHADAHRQDMIAQFRLIRAELDAFNPDFVLIWGDDQYENFREGCVPSFCVMAGDSHDFQPWKNYKRGRNVWDEPADHVIHVKGHRAAGKHVARALLEAGIDVAYSYKPLHHPLGHAFANSVMFLDYDRKGFDYPLLPLAVNAYGRWLIAGGGIQPSPTGDLALPMSRDELDPPGPQPWRCFDLGGAVARTLRASPWRVAVIASSSWSHSFLVRKNARLFPDVEADRRYFEALQKGDWDFWRRAKLDDVEDSGQHELLNWFCLAGAMNELGCKAPDHAVFLESWVTNSDKVFAVFRAR